jgi:hypothetical protein
LIRRTATLLLCAAIAALSLAASASATQNNYWGFNFITLNNPPAGTCPSRSSGEACSGFNYWDYSQVQINSSYGQVLYGFEKCTGCNWSGFFTNPGQTGTYTIIWNASIYNPPFHYNKAACSYFGGGESYVQCRAYIF